MEKNFFLHMYALNSRDVCGFNEICCQNLEIFANSFNSNDKAYKDVQYVLFVSTSVKYLPIC